jgi:hypothetical protein
VNAQGGRFWTCATPSQPRTSPEPAASAKDDSIIHIPYQMTKGTYETLQLGGTKRGIWPNRKWFQIASISFR